MRPSPFIYHQPATLAEALAAMAVGALPLAGGQSLLQAMRLRDVEPTSVCALNQVKELDRNIEFLPDVVRIGALVTHRELADNVEIKKQMPWLSEAAAALGDVQVRNLGTVLGNVCWADPRANLAVALLASDAQIVVASTAEQFEHLPIVNFFTGFRLNALGPRLAVAIEIPRSAEARGTYREFSRQPQDLALVNITVIRTIRTVAIAVGGIDACPVRLGEVELVAGTGGINALNAALADELTTMKHRPVVDQHGSAHYKLELAATLIRRALVPRGNRRD